MTLLTATPSNSGEIVVAEAGVDFDSATGVSGPAGALFLSAVYTGQPEPVTFDESNFWAVYYAPNTTAQIWKMVHNAQDGGGVGNWSAAASAFSGSTQTVNPPSSLSATVQ